MPETWRIRMGWVRGEKKREVHSYMNEWWHSKCSNLFWFNELFKFCWNFSCFLRSLRDCRDLSLHATSLSSFVFHFLINVWMFVIRLDWIKRDRKSLTNTIRQFVSHFFSGENLSLSLCEIASSNLVSICRHHQPDPTQEEWNFIDLLFFEGCKIYIWMIFWGFNQRGGNLSDHVWSVEVSFVDFSEREFNVSGETFTKHTMNRSESWKVNQIYTNWQKSFQCLHVAIMLSRSTTSTQNDDKMCFIYPGNCKMKEKFSVFLNCCVCSPPPSVQLVNSQVSRGNCN